MARRAPREHGAEGERRGARLGDIAGTGCATAPRASRTVRAFFALELGQEARVAAGGVIRELRARPHGDTVRWVRTEALHVTLRFLGEIALGRVPGLLRDVAAQVAALPTFALDLGPLQAFPSLRSPRVVALGIEPEAPVLGLGRAVEAGVVAAGFAPERRALRVHVTLGRTRSSPAGGRGRRAPAGQIPSLEALALRPATPFHVREIVLFGSTLGPGGSIYTALERIALGWGAASDAAPGSEVQPDSGVPEETPDGNDHHDTH